MLKKNWAFFLVLFFFILLLARNPFSTRTLIPNLEPYPDTIHYVNPAISFIQGHGLQLYREGRATMTAVPPLYSLFLIPIFLLKQDVRMFYFTNIILALLSYTFFYLILKKIINTDVLKKTPNQMRNTLLVFVALFLYVANYFTYWYPTLAMSENLTLFLFVVGVYLFILPLSKKNILLGGMVAVAFYITKYASIPLTGIYLLFFVVKIFLNKKKIVTDFIILIGPSALLFLLYSIWEWNTKGSTLLMTLLGVFIPQKTATVLSSGNWFSLSYVSKNFPRYMLAILGGYRAPFLWDQTPIVPIFVGALGLIGLILTSLRREFKLFALLLLTLLMTSVVFMSTFYSFDMRYLNFSIPLLLIGFTFFWHTIFARNNLKKAAAALLIILFLYYLGTNAIRLKSQISLNLRYAETPWYYLSVIKMNDYFGSLPKNEKKPVLISPMIPYYIDFFSNKTFTLLPLSKHQEFRNTLSQTWGDYSYSDLPTLYAKFLKNGFDVFVDNYGVGNEKDLQNDFNLIHQKFNTKLVSEGCLGSCNIWQLSIKD